MSTPHTLTNLDAELADGPLRALSPQWNRELIAASIAISLLGAFTSTQLMCQARTSVRFSTVLVWTLLSSVTFGFCSVWCLHEVAMLACELDLPVGVDPTLTAVSALLATGFTFAALSSDLLWDRYKKQKRRYTRRRSSRRVKRLDSTSKSMWSLLPTQEHDDTTVQEVEEAIIDDAYHDEEDGELRPLSREGRAQESAIIEEDEEIITDEDDAPDTTQSTLVDGTYEVGRSIMKKPARVSDVSPVSPDTIPDVRTQAAFVIAHEEPLRRPSMPMERSNSENSSARSLSNASSFGLNSLVNVAWLRTSAPVQNVFVLTATTLWAGLTAKNLVKGFFWSLAITSMHYVGIGGLRIPHGYYTLSPILFLASALISWIVCVVGTIFMAKMETHLPQQVLFSVVATTGVAAMHFTGMRAVTFWSIALPSERRGYPPELLIAVASIAITTCIAANGLLAHSATVSRNKLAEIVYTRKQLWRTIAQKENAEAAAAARSDFIASASHEIRTPLHHLQGYSDLLARTELSEESRMLLSCIQRATQTLSLITNNVLDWSKLEKDAEGICRPIALDIRTICESVIILLPNKDDEAEVELLVVVTPDVPHTLFLDETYIHRMLMNLLSNALKFTRSGYITLIIEMEDSNLLISVKDSGCGIPRSFLPVMFEPFKQAQTLGNQRGTGLGLSIIKQLLSKMGGSIHAESKYGEDPDVEESETGSTFTITLPVRAATPTTNTNIATDETKTIALFCNGNPRSSEGIAISWQKYGIIPVICSNESDLASGDWTYIWADLPALKENPTLLKNLLQRTEIKVLIPCELPTSPQDILDLKSPPSHFVYLPKPLIWHSFEKRIEAAMQPVAVTKGVRFATEVEIVEAPDTPITPITPVMPVTPNNQAIPEPLAPIITTTNSLPPSSPAPNPPKSKGTILLVEDNPINAKLGSRMLTTLGYTPLLAIDGVDALVQLQANDHIIDGILMDQSMPRKDGITATRDIRALEEAGVLTRKKQRRRPIIAVTAVVSSEAEKLFEDAGADGFLAKPLSLQRLESTLEKFFGAGNEGGMGGSGSGAG